jgi:hypothetical protein
MRISALLILVVGLVSFAAPTRAQTFDPNYPVCVQISEWGGWRIECSYTSMAQCKASASGLGRTCMPNPYFGLDRRGRRY